MLLEKKMSCQIVKHIKKPWMFNLEDTFSLHPFSPVNLKVLEWRKLKSLDRKRHDVCLICVGSWARGAWLEYDQLHFHLRAIVRGTWHHAGSKRNPCCVWVLQFHPCSWSSVSLLWQRSREPFWWGSPLWLFNCSAMVRYPCSCRRSSRLPKKQLSGMRDHRQMTTFQKLQDGWIELWSTVTTVINQCEVISKKYHRLKLLCKHTFLDYCCLR